MPAFTDAVSESRSGGVRRAAGGIAAAPAGKGPTPPLSATYLLEAMQEGAKLSVGYQGATAELLAAQQQVGARQGVGQRAERRIAGECQLVAGLAGKVQAAWGVAPSQAVPGPVWGQSLEWQPAEAE